MTQLTLNLASKQARGKHGPRLAKRLIAILSMRKTWTTRTQLLNEYGMDSRSVRLGRECSHGRIISGQKGYLLTNHATPEEIRAACNAFLAQIKSEQEQYRMLVLRSHRILAEKVA